MINKMWETVKGWFKKKPPTNTLKANSTDSLLINQTDKFIL